MTERMKAITLWQPWASLVAYGLKTIETRSWHTHYRGPIAIHASKQLVVPLGWPLQLINDVVEVIGPFRDLPLGCMIATAELYQMVQSLDVASQRVFERTGTSYKNLKYRLRVQEAYFGDFRPGRVAWMLRNPKRFTHPVPVRGRQGLWTWMPKRRIPLPALEVFNG